MMRNKIPFILILVFSIQSLWAQQRYTINGTLRDQKTGETVIGATVLVKEVPGMGVSSNGYGFYALSLPAGKYTIVYSFLGYKEEIRTVDVTKNQKIDVALVDDAMQIEEVVVTATPRNANVTLTQVGVERMELKEVAKMPVLFGEKDAMKSLQLLPGVSGAGEGSSGFYVRGGTSDQNLILLDEAPVYNATHLMGFFSTFNSDAIKDVTIYKGNGPAQYGGRLSSVLDVKMNDGNNQNFGMSGGLGLISSRLNAEGPIQKGKSSYIVTARRSYADLFLKLSNDETTRKSKLYFYDLNAKMNYTLSSKDRLFVSGYFGRDVMWMSKTFGLDWGNATATVRWNRVINDRLFSNTSVIYSHYDYTASMNLGDNEMALKSYIRDWNLKQEFQYYHNDRNQFRFGANVIHHTIAPGRIVVSENSSLLPETFEDRLGGEAALFFSHEWKATQKFSMIYGMRVSAFTAFGPGSFLTMDPDGNLVDGGTYRSWEAVKTFVNPEPRISLNYMLTPTSSIKGGYARNVQYLHLIANSATTSPADMWMASNKIVKPQQSDLYSLGYFKNLSDNRYELSVEAYYKPMFNQIDYRDGADIYNRSRIEEELLFGKGRAYGVEFFIKKKQGRFNGWISYTLSRVEKKIDGINRDTWYPARQDRTHDLSIVGIYSHNTKWDFSFVWVYNTGNAVTFPSGKYEVDGTVQFYYTERNGYRMPAYHRLDLSATWYRKRTKKFESSWNFSLYNAYGRENAYAINFRQNEDDPTKTEAVQVTLFRWVPSVTYNFKF